MDITLWIFGGFAAVVLIFIGFAAWRVMKTPLGEGEGIGGSGSSPSDATHQHRDLE